MHSLFIKKLFQLALVFVLTGGVLLPTHKSFAQDTASSTAGIDTRGALGTILMSGLVGGIIGLSTLSFYDKPKNAFETLPGVGVLE